MSEKTFYAVGYEKHYGAVLGMLRYSVAQLADEAVEIAARGVALAAPLPNAISMYNISQKELDWSWQAALAFAVTLEIVVFLLVEVALLLWDGYLTNPQRYWLPFNVIIGVVLIAVAVVMGLVFTLETHKIMATLPIVSLCSFVGIGLKRWHERTSRNTVQDIGVPEVQEPAQPANDETIDRRQRVATYYKDNATASYQAAADALNISSKTTVYNDLKWLEKRGVLHVQRDGKTTNVAVNGQYDSFVNG